MPSRLVPCVAALLVVLLPCSALLLAQEQQPAVVGDQSAPGVGGASVFAGYKLLIVAIFYLLWVALSDWMNRDLLRWGTQMKLDPETWNLINVLCFGMAFLLVLLIPIFWASLPALVLASFVPMLVYRSVRKGRIAEDAELAFRISGGSEGVEETPLAQDEGVLMEFTAAGGSEEEQTANLIRARQGAAFVQLKDLLVTSITNRADLIALDYTRQSVAGKMMVDGTWHNLPPLDRQTGDALLYSLKCLAGLNPTDRRNQQIGKFGLKWLDMSLKANFELVTAGVPTGERVQLKTLRAASKDLTLVQLGMWPEMQAELVKAMNEPGLVLVSAPPRTGLTSTWRSALLACDRLTRDVVGLIPSGDVETEVENVQVRIYTAEKLAETLRATWLQQPDALAFPNLLETKVVNEVLQEVVEEKKSVFIRAQANSAVEALLAALAKAPDKKLFAQAITAVSGQRLVRRLCDNCKQPLNLKPEAIVKLGGNPKTAPAVYTHFQLPPPEQRVDEKGQPIEIPPCPICQGIGYIGRIAAYDLVQVDNGLRELLLKNPSTEKVDAYLRGRGQLSQLQQAYRLVLVGVTSIAEVQRVFAPPRAG